MSEWIASAAGVDLGLDETGLLTVRFNRPETYNGLDADILDAAAGTLERARGRDDVRAVLITGTGKAFSSGATLAGADPLAAFDSTSVTRANRLIRAVVALDAPVLAAVNGVAAGFGAAVAFASDLQLASSSASFALTFTRIGLMPDGGSTATVAAAIGRPRAMRMALLGEKLPAAEAYAAGLVSHLVDADEFAAARDDLTTRLCSLAPLAYAATKRAVNAATLAGLEDALERENRGQLALFGTEDTQEGMSAFVQKRPARFTGR